MKKALTIAVNAFIWIFFVFALLITTLAITAQKNDGLPSIFGKMPISIVADSMKPTFKKGDLIFDKAVAGEEKSNMAVGDVITFFTDLNGDGIQEVNTHRIVEKSEKDGYVFYTTRGDNAETNKKNDDMLVRYDMVVGQYTGQKIGGLGTVMSFLQSSNGFMLCIVAPLIVFFLFELYRFIVTVIASKNKGQLTAEKEDEIKKKAVEEYLKQKGKNDESKE